MHAWSARLLTLRNTRRLQAMHMRQSKKMGVLEDPQAVSGHQVRWVRSVSAADLAPFAIGTYLRPVFMHATIHTLTPLVYQSINREAKMVEATRGRSQTGFDGSLMS